MENFCVFETMKNMTRESEQLSISLPRVSESADDCTNHLICRKQNIRKELSSKIDIQVWHLKKRSQMCTPRTLIRPSHYPETQLKSNLQHFPRPRLAFQALKIPKCGRHPRCTCLSLNHSNEHYCISPNHITEHEPFNLSEYPKREQRHTQLQFNQIDLNKEIASHVFSNRKTLRENFNTFKSSPASRTPAIKTKYKRTRHSSWGNRNPSELKQ